MIYKKYKRNKSLCKNFNRKTILITGAANGIGKILSQKLANEQATLFLLDINGPLLEATVQEIKEKSKNIHITGISCDVSDYNLVQETIKKIENINTIDILINNAGCVNGKSIMDLTCEDIKKTFNVNIFSHFWLVKSILPYMIKRKKGLIVTIASSMGLVGSAKLSDYCASKWAAIGFHESLCLELLKEKNSKIQTLLVCPIGIKTGMFKGAFNYKKKTILNMISNYLVPMLNPNIVVDNIISAMREDKELLIGCDSSWRKYILPWFSIILHIFPPSFMYFIISLLGGTHAMDNFIGREENNEVKKKKII